MPLLTDLANGIQPDPGYQSCKSGWKIVPTSGIGPGFVRRFETSGPMCLVQDAIPFPRYQCDEALYNRTTHEWTCARTGEECGQAGKPACVAPTKLFTWVDDFNAGVVKVPVTPEGEPIYPESFGKPKEASSGSITPLLIGGAGLVLVFLLGRRGA